MAAPIYTGDENVSETESFDAAGAATGNERKQQSTTASMELTMIVSGLPEK